MGVDRLVMTVTYPDVYPSAYGDPGASTFSLQVTGMTANFGVYTSVSGLVAGETYTVSGYVWPNASPGVNANLRDIQVVLNPAVSGSALVNSGTGTSIPAGTTPPTTQALQSWVQVNGVDTTTPEWYRPSLTFVAPESNVNIGFWGIPVTGSSFSSGTFTLDDVMVNPGNLIAYGDGYSTGWNWQTAGLPGGVPSYYYQRMNVASQAIIQVLQQHVPLGQYAYQPLYYTEVTGYS
jgi:hypothetical protein